MAHGKRDCEVDFVAGLVDNISRALLLEAPVPGRGTSAAKRPYIAVPQAAILASPTKQTMYCSRSADSNAARGGRSSTF